MQVESDRDTFSDVDETTDFDLPDSASLTSSIDAPIPDDIHLVLSANDGDVNTVLQLLDSGVSIESIDEDGSTPLIAASFGSNSSPQTLTTIKLLLDRGANTSAVQEKHGWTPIIAASYVGAVQKLELLLSYHRKQSHNSQTLYQILKHRDKLGKDAMQYVCDNMLEVSRMLQDGFNYQSAYFAFIEAKEDALRNNMPFLDDSFSIPQPEPGEENLADTLDRHLSCKASLNRALDQASIGSTKGNEEGNKKSHEPKRKEELDDSRSEAYSESKNEVDILSSSSVTTVLGEGSSLSRHLSSSTFSAIKARASLGRKSNYIGTNNNNAGGSMTGKTLMSPPQRQELHRTSSTRSTKKSKQSISSSTIPSLQGQGTTVKVIDESLARSWSLVPLFYLLFLVYKWWCST